MFKFYNLKNTLITQLMNYFIISYFIVVLLMCTKIKSSRLIGHSAESKSSKVEL